MTVMATNAMLQEVAQCASFLPQCTLKVIVIWGFTDVPAARL